MGTALDWADQHFRIRSGPIVPLLLIGRYLLPDARVSKVEQMFEGKGIGVFRLPQLLDAPPVTINDEQVVRFPGSASDN
jgi:hypothetical protein